MKEDILRFGWRRGEGLGFTQRVKGGEKIFMPCYIRIFQVERHNQDWRGGLTSTRCDVFIWVGWMGGRLE